jgi:hypothetical protein
MRPTIFGSFISVVLILMPLAAYAEDNADCSFSAPTGLLQPQAYNSYAYRPALDNEAFESAYITKDMHLEIHHSQCVDFVVQEFVFTLNAPLDVSPLDFAIKQIENIKLSESERRPTELLAFLKGRAKKSFVGKKISACRDGSSAPPGECPWDSLGGYTFEVKRDKKRITIVVTEYISG